MEINGLYCNVRVYFFLTSTLLSVITLLSKKKQHLTLQTCLNEYCRIFDLNVIKLICLIVLLLAKDFHRH